MNAKSNTAENRKEIENMVSNSMVKPSPDEEGKGPISSTQLPTQQPTQYLKYSNNPSSGDWREPTLEYIKNSNNPSSGDWREPSSETSHAITPNRVRARGVRRHPSAAPPILHSSAIYSIGPPNVSHTLNEDIKRPPVQSELAWDYTNDEMVGMDKERWCSTDSGDMFDLAHPSIPAKILKVLDTSSPSFSSSSRSRLPACSRAVHLRAKVNSAALKESGQLISNENFKAKLANNKVWNGYVGLEAVARKVISMEKAESAEMNSDEIVSGKFAKLNIRSSSNVKEVTPKSRTRPTRTQPTRTLAARGGREKCSFYNYHQYDEPDNDVDSQECAEGQMKIYNEIMGIK